MDLSCSHSKLTFSRPTAVSSNKNHPSPSFYHVLCLFHLQADLALHIRLLSLAHGVSLSGESANQIVASFNCDIRRTFHYMHTWLSWSPGNGVEAPPPSSFQLPHSYSISADWRNASTFDPCPPTKTSATPEQLELLHAATVADHLATLDLLKSPEAADSSSPSSPWWRVAPDNHLLDELSETTSTDAVVTQMKQDIVAEMSRLSVTLPNQNQRYMNIIEVS